MIEKLDKWHRTRIGLLVFAVVELAIAYGFLSLSIDRGNFLLYLLTLIFLIGGVQNLFKFFKTLGNGKK